MIPTCRDHLASPGPLGESAIGGNRASLSFPSPWPLPRSESAEYAKLFSASGNKLPRKRAGGTLATHSNLHQSTGPGGLTNKLLSICEQFFAVVAEVHAGEVHPEAEEDQSLLNLACDHAGHYFGNR